MRTIHEGEEYEGKGETNELSRKESASRNMRNSVGHEDFEEFVLDFEDYDLWESIKTHLNDPEGTSSCVNLDDQSTLRRHIAAKNRVSRKEPTITAPIWTRAKRKRDKGPHEVFVELNELICEGVHKMQWRETARWIKFEENVEQETSRWGKPHVASLSFRSLLELRKTITNGTLFLDLEQTTMPRIVQTIVDTMVVSEQIGACDRASVQRALLLKHSHPNDGREAHHPRSSTGSSTGNHLENNSPPIENSFSKSHDADSKQKTLNGPEGHRMKHWKLMEKIPENAEATVVLVGCVDFLEQAATAFVRLDEAVLLESVLEVPIPVRFLYVLLGPTQANMDYHEIGRSISTLMSDKVFHEAAYTAAGRQDLLNAINEFLDCSMVLPPCEMQSKDLLRSIAAFQKDLLRKRREREQRRSARENVPPTVQEARQLKPDDEEDDESQSDPLERSGYLFGGLVRDIRRRYVKYWSDIKDGLNSQCLAAALFIYFAALSPAITFGGLLGEKTQGLMGVSELIVSTSVLGVIFALLAAQPLLIVGFSGPLLVFEEAFFKFCQVQEIEYLTGRVWIGFWLIFFILVMVAAEGSFLVRYISPFTQEIFAFLISLIFIHETFYKLYKVFAEHPLLRTYPPVGAVVGRTAALGPRMQPNTALLSLILMVGTFLIAFFLRKFKNSRFLGGQARRVIGDFGIPISILVMVFIDYAITDTYTQKLNVPSGLSVTSPGKRGWFIDPMGTSKPFPLWMMFASAIPALLVFILMFMETQITTLIVSRKERRLQKGSGFHLDLLLIGSLGGVCALFGLPWLTATTVRSVTHINALTVMSKTAPGEKPRIAEVKEQRVTAVLISALVGLSIVMGEMLRQIPLAVLFGIFLYMGVTSLTGIQLFERLLLILMHPKHHPEHPYVVKVCTWRMHLFTCVQLSCIVILWVVKSSPASLAFPFLLILTVPLRRFVLPRFFQERELKALDSEDVEPNFDEDGRDEYNELHMPV
ncbi:anion exchange protein 3 isoform X2 [Xenopus tropicalis]|uniref:Anion exchange protein n=1 Tax=Xenopus tropicalis TaxID=8364 RepID=A0A1B8Y266_XENTR|nr:anion exchange protein 3 isoform X2 [Xenopus tropicalis]|eukprot:XP_017945571.1 PREDICTED: anion exchange protein 3 isoform X2 [Xenopus tropicalis]